MRGAHAPPGNRRRLPRLALVVPLLLVLAISAGYAASPLATAWSIREAVRNGNSDYLRTAVDWPRIKETLKVSMFRYAIGPAGDVAAVDGRADAGETDIATAPRPGLWQRIKEAYGRSVVDGLIESYVTPEGLPKLFAYRRGYNETFRSIPDEAKTLSWPERIRGAWARVIRAEFVTPTTFAIEMRDKIIEHRSYLGHLELQGGTWKLVHLEVKGQRPQGTISRAWSALKQAALP